MKTLHVGINGFGRIGRTFFRLAQKVPHINVVAINDLASAKTLAHLLKYDSNHGIFEAEVSATKNAVIVNGQKIPVSNFPEPALIPWQESEVDVVLESSGKFKKRKKLEGHLIKKVKKVLLSVPPQDNSIKMVVYGINHEKIIAEDAIISSASCTTNNAAPMIQVIQDLCGIEQAYITTIHSYTTDQSLQDQPHRDLRRARAAALSIVPTTTGAAKALTKIFPQHASKIGGCGIRVPVANGSLTDITFNVSSNTSIKEINQAFRYAAQNKLKQILYYTEDPIVSIDINNSCHSCTFDSLMTSVIGKMVKVIGWYDNETGYSSRLIDILLYLKQKNYV